MEHSRVSMPVAMMMLSFALIIDGTQFLLAFIPLIGWLFSWLVGFIASLTIAIWCSHLGISRMDPKNVFGFMGVSFLEVVPIPFLDALPAWTAYVFFSIILGESRKSQKRS